jgi:hypothetical protein
VSEALELAPYRKEERLGGLTVSRAAPTIDAPRTIAKMQHDWRSKIRANVKTQHKRSSTTRKSMVLSEILLF